MKRVNDLVRTVAPQLVSLERTLRDAGLHETARAVNAVTQKLGWEAAGLLERDLKASIKRNPTTCGWCDFEEADGSLIKQCTVCKTADKMRAKGLTPPPDHRRVA